MKKFSSLIEAQSFIRHAIDTPLTYSSEFVRPGVRFTQATIDLGDGRFTNSYDLAFNSNDRQTEIIAFDTATSVYDFASNNKQYAAAASGGFFFLADRASSLPKQLALNLSISRGNLRSLPVVDRESVVAGHNSLAVRNLVALGTLSLNGHGVDWSGSLTDYDTEIKVYGNGNAIINHYEDTVTGSVRVLEEISRYTPEIEKDELIDIGFVGRGGNNFIGVAGSTAGGVDIFAHDFVLRCPQRFIEGNSELEVHTIGGIALSRFGGGAFSAGPAINLADFQNHPINRDTSLGTWPPFMDRPLARTVLYKSEDDLTHIRLFDGRPGSSKFPGVTPTEAASQVISEGGIEWGCFLDPGQTAKLCVNADETTADFGNRHYLQWPNESNPDFIWTPQAGRPVANVIAL